MQNMVGFLFNKFSTLCYNFLCNNAWRKYMFNQKILENELSHRSNKVVRFSYETYHSPDDFVFFRKLLVDNKEVGIKINLDDLQKAQESGILEEKYEEILTKIHQYLLTKRWKHVIQCR